MNAISYNNTIVKCLAVGTKRKECCIVVEINESTVRKDGSKAGYRVLGVVRTVFIYLLAIGIIVAVILFASSKSPNKSMFGFRYYTVLTPSMEPVYSVGDMVIVKVTNADDINVGDIITFNPSSDGEAHLTHRVVEKLPDYNGTGVTCFLTKGDANDSEDSFLIDEDRVIGVAKLHIPVLGYGRPRRSKCPQNPALRG